jgi:hypothetical protein
MCVGIAAVGCQGSSQATAPPPTGSQPEQVASHARLLITPRDGAGRVKPSAKIAVRAVDATLTAVSVRGGG